MEKSEIALELTKLWVVDNSITKEKILEIYQYYYNGVRNYNN